MKKFSIRYLPTSPHHDGERGHRSGTFRIVMTVSVLVMASVLVMISSVSEAQQLPTEGMNPGDRLVGGGVSWDRLNQTGSNTNQNSPVPVQVGDAGGVIFTQPGLRNRGAFSPIPRMPWTTGDSQPDSTLQGRPFETSMGPHVIGGYTILPTLSGVSRVNSAFGGIPSPGRERIPVSASKERFDRYQAELDAQRAAENRSEWNPDVVRGAASRSASVRAVASALPIYAETSVPNFNQNYRPAPIPPSVFGGEMGNPEPQGVISSAGRPMASDVANNAGADVANAPVWMRDPRNNADVAPNATDRGADGNGMNGDGQNLSSPENGQNVQTFENEAHAPAEAFYQPLATDTPQYGGDPASSIAQKIFNASAVRRTTPMHVFVQGNTVVLQGSVRSLYDRDLAEAIAASEPGIRRVKNQLRVQD